MKGRKKKPTAIKKLNGTLQPCRTNKKEPKPAADFIAPPDWLDKRCLKHWKEIAPHLKAAGVLTNVDTTALAALCSAIVMYIESEKKMWPLIAVTKKGNVIQNPYVSVNRQAFERMMRVMADFGMTPSSRASLTASPAEKEDGWETV